MITLIRTDSGNPDFQKLVADLDKDLQIRDGEDHSFFAQFNKIDLIKYVIVAYRDGEAVGCGAIKQYGEQAMEIKRMYVPPASRGQGIASQILTALEHWAAELQFSACILETGEKQPEAIQLYKKNNYVVIPNYGQYAAVPTSICFEKKLVHHGRS